MLPYFKALKVCKRGEKLGLVQGFVRFCYIVSDSLEQHLGWEFLSENFHSFSALFLTVLESFKYMTTLMTKIKMQPL